MLLEERLGFRARKEHEQQQAELIEEIERGPLGLGVEIELQGVAIERQLAEHKRAEQDAGQDFANHARLAEPGKEIAEQMRRGEKDREKENEGSYGGGWHLSPVLT